MVTDAGLPEPIETERCFFCGKEGADPCGSAECQQIAKDIENHLEDTRKTELRSAVRAALVQRCKYEEDWRPHRFARWFYTVKALLCVYLGLTRDFEKVPGYPQRVTVACHHHAQLYAGWEASYLIVGRGVFSHWWYDLEHDGDWWL